MQNFLTEKTHWSILDSHWVNVYRDFHQVCQDYQVHTTTLYPGVLADYLWLVGFDIPSDISYCIAENDHYQLMFSKQGGLITIFLRSNK